MKISPLLLLCAALAQGNAERAPDIDRYPDSYRLLQEAEKAASRLPADSEDRQRFKFRAAGLYARAGYIADATRLLGKLTSDAPVWRARVVYGDLAGAEQSLQAITDPERITAAKDELALLLWKMGRTDEARVHYAAAKQSAATIVNPKHRAAALRSIELATSFLAEESPVKISAAPHPPDKPPAPRPSRPSFPITTGGFAKAYSSALQTKSDEEFLTRMFAFLAASDRGGLVCVTRNAATPFQKTLGFASIEHIAIEQGQPQIAENYAAAMPEDDSDCRLAKAEALSAAGSAWVRADKTEQAAADFEAAAKLVESVRDLPFGAVTVMLTIASAQSQGGMVAGSGRSFARAGELAQQMPLAAAAPPSGGVRLVRNSQHHRQEMYRLIFRAAMQAHDLGAAREVAKLWDRPGAAADIAQAWLDVGRQDDAILFARQIPDAQERASVLLTLALRLLDQAGAPNF